MAVNSYSSYDEQLSLIVELTQGLDLAKQLKAHMGQEVSSQTHGMLLEKILSSYEKSLLILKWVGSVEQSQHHVVPPENMPGSPISVIGSPNSGDLNPGSNAQHDSRDFSRKRKMMCSWTKQEKVSTENALEGPPDDGYSWRKYGQKDILGAKHPRSYYRCTYRKSQGCYATKQVQRNDEDPTVFNITCKGTHTCTPVLHSKSAPTPKKQEHKSQHIFPTMEYQHSPEVMLNFHSGLSVGIQSLEDQEIIAFPLSTTGSGYENHPFHDSFQQSFVLSPTTSGSNYFGGVHHGEHDESKIAEIISATTSSTNSPIISSSDFPLDLLEFNPGFPYDNQDIFSELLSS